MKKKVIIVGAFHEIIELTEDIGFKIVGLIDNVKSTSYRNYKVLCCDKEAIKLCHKLKIYPLIITPDKPETRQVLSSHYRKYGYRFTSLISKDAKLSRSAKIGLGVVIQYGVNVSAECNIGNFVKLNTECNIMHNSIIGDYTTVAANAVILGNVKIGRLCYIGSNATILPNIQICDNSIIGAGAVLTKDISIAGTYTGVPAKLLYKTK